MLSFLLFEFIAFSKILYLCIIEVLFQESYDIVVHKYVDFKTKFLHIGRKLFFPFFDNGIIILEYFFLEK